MLISIVACFVMTLLVVGIAAIAGLLIALLIDYLLEKKDE